MRMRFSCLVKLGMPRADDAGVAPGVVQDPERAETERGGCASLDSVQMGGQSVTVNVSVMLHECSIFPCM